MKNMKIVLLSLVFMAYLNLSPCPAFAVVITVVNLDGAGEGFNDATPADADSTTGGNTGTTLGAQRLRAFQHAANLWGAELESNVPIRVGARFDPLTCNATSAILGSAGPVTALRDFVGALRAGTFYPIALANKLNGTDLAPTADDITATFNSSVGTTCAFPNVWYYGLNAKPPSGKIDFVSVILHELAHGLGFVSFVNLGTGAKLQGLDDAYTVHLENHSTGKKYPDMTDAERVAASTSNGNLHWTGPLLVSNSAGLSAGKIGPSGHVRMYAPATQTPGSSVSHFDTALTPNEQQEPSYTGPDHTVGLSRQLLCDIGWCNGDPVDVFLLTDLGKSFTDDLSAMKAQLPTVIDGLAKRYDFKIGIGSYADYPITPFGVASAADFAYRRNSNMTSNYASFKTTLAGLTTKDGGDEPDSQLAALYYASNGLGQDLSANGFANANLAAGQNPAFRRSAEKLFLLLSDSIFHKPGDPGTIAYPGPAFNSMVSAVLKLNPIEVAAIVPGGNLSALEDASNTAIATDAIAPAEGIDCDKNGLLDIAADKPIVCSTSATGVNIGVAVNAVVQAAFSAETVPITIPASIDLKVVSINTAILSTATFDALSVNPTTVCLSTGRNPGVGDCTEAHNIAHPGQDMNGDGRLDLVLHFDTAETGLAAGGRTACLTGKTKIGKKIVGCSSVTVF